MNYFFYLLLLLFLFLFIFILFIFIRGVLIVIFSVCFGYDIIYFVVILNGG